MGAMREAGVDPKRANEPAINRRWTQWVHGKLTRAQFLDRIRPLARS